MYNIDQDLNIFYQGGSGGFYLLHSILLAGQHWCNFYHDPEFNQSLLAQAHSHWTAQELDALRLTKHSYDQCRDPSWPDYDSYNKDFPRIDPVSVVQELRDLHSHWAYNIDSLPGGFDWEFNLVRQHQWAPQSMSDWKSREHWPENHITLQANISDRPHRIYFVCGELDQWLTYPGRKIVLYTDTASRIALSRAKRAGMFVNQTTPPNEIAAGMIADSVQYQNQLIGKESARALDHADFGIYLQDFILQPQTVLNTTVTPQHQAFSKHWLSLHPDSLLETIGLK